MLRDFVRNVAPRDFMTSDFPTLSHWNRQSVEVVRYASPVMAWVWAIFGAFWTAGVAAFALSAWKSADRWKRDGLLNNGLGYVLKRSDRPRSFAIVIWFSKAFAVFGALLGLFGIGITLGWIAKAL